MNLQKIYVKKHKITWLILTHATRIPNKGRIANKIFRVQTGRISSWTYSKADVYRGSTVITLSSSALKGKVISILIGLFFPSLLFCAGAPCWATLTGGHFMAGCCRYLQPRVWRCPLLRYPGRSLEPGRMRGGLLHRQAVPKTQLLK
jgi:hypothetical protein